MKKTIGQVAFEAYTASTDGKTWDGKPVPSWDEIKERTPHVCKAWKAAALAANVAMGLYRQRIVDGKVLCYSLGQAGEGSCIAPSEGDLLDLLESSDMNQNGPQDGVERWELTFQWIDEDRLEAMQDHPGF